MKKYLVSILIPVYKASDFIESCAESVFSQTFESIEYIFVDDGTPDDSIECLKKILEDFPARKDDVKIIQNPINQGISVARQKAFDAAAGDYFLAMDSDDYIEPDMVELLYNKAVETKADIVYCNYFEEFDDRNQKLFSINFSENKKKQIENVLNGQSAYWNKLISRKLLRENHIKTISGVDMADDLIVLVKLVYYANNFAFVDKPLYHYVQYNTNAVTKSYKPKHIEDYLKVVQEVNNFFREKPDYKEYENSLMHYKALRKIKIIRSTFAEGKYLTLYPELKQWRGEMALPLKSKIILFLSQNQLQITLRIFLKILRALDKTKKSL